MTGTSGLAAYPIEVEDRPPLRSAQALAVGGRFAGRQRLNTRRATAPRVLPPTGRHDKEGSDAAVHPYGETTNRQLAGCRTAGASGGPTPQRFVDPQRKNSHRWRAAAGAGSSGRYPGARVPASCWCRAAARPTRGQQPVTTRCGVSHQTDAVSSRSCPIAFASRAIHRPGVSLDTVSRIAAANGLCPMIRRGLCVRGQNHVAALMWM